MTEALAPRRARPAAVGFHRSRATKPSGSTKRRPTGPCFDDVHRIRAQLPVRRFQTGPRFVAKVGELPKPKVITRHQFGWGYATVSLQTKKIKGLHENDFIMQARSTGCRKMEPPGKRRLLRRRLDGRGLGWRWFTFSIAGARCWKRFAWDDSNPRTQHEAENDQDTEYRCDPAPAALAKEIAAGSTETCRRV